MKNFYKKASLIIVLIFIANFGYSQTNEIKVKFIGNCGLYMTDGNLNIYVDFPYKSGAHNYMEYDKSEIDSIKENPIFIFTHKHSDHYSKKLLKKLNGKKYTPRNVSELNELNDTVNEFSTQVFKTKHRFSFKHYSYLITWHNKKIFISGDTESADTIIEIKDMDWAFIPAWLVSKIQQTGKSLDAKKIGIYHIGPGDDINITGENVIMFKKQGEVISIPY